MDNSECPEHISDSKGFNILQSPEEWTARYSVQKRTLFSLVPFDLALIVKKLRIANDQPHPQYINSLNMISDLLYQKAQICPLFLSICCKSVRLSSVVNSLSFASFNNNHGYDRKRGVVFDQYLSIRHLAIMDQSFGPSGVRIRGFRCSCIIYYTMSSYSSQLIMKIITECYSFISVFIIILFYQ